jgi:hypothetical protein
MATKYFNDAEANGDWNDAGNWWLNDDGTGATTIPTASDDAVLLASVSTNSGDPAVCNTLAMPDAGNVGGYIAIEVTATNGATFGGSAYNATAVNGGAVFNDTSYNQGTVNGGAVFNDTSYNQGTVDVGAVFNDTSYNQGTVNGGAVFNDTSYHSGAVTSGDVVFNDSSFATASANLNGANSVRMGVLNARLTVADTFLGVSDPSGVIIPQGINGSSILGLP